LGDDFIWNVTAGRAPCAASVSVNCWKRVFALNLSENGISCSIASLSASVATGLNLAVANEIGPPKHNL
jgi:hypothetical protein